jgi:hypothetical protein
MTLTLLKAAMGQGCDAVDDAAGSDTRKKSI